MAAATIPRLLVTQDAAPRAHGRELGEAAGARIARNLEVYRELWAQAGAPIDDLALGAGALAATRRWAPALAEEVEGIAAGAGLRAEEVAAMNARTELLAAARLAARPECSTVVVLRPGLAPIAVQTWDWHEELDDGWLVWKLALPGGRTVTTLTEAGIVGKIGVNGNGVGVLVNILRHADDSGEGVPVHVVARRILDEAQSLAEARALCASAQVGASSALTIVSPEGAFCVELHPSGPAFVEPEQGLLVHTNHFLHPDAAAGDTYLEERPGSLLRRSVLLERLHDAPVTDARGVIGAMTHHDEAGSVCCHPAPGAQLGERWRTLATVEVSCATRTLRVREGGPCGRRS